MILGVDFETYSAVDLRAVGADAYARHPSTGVHCGVLGLASGKSRYKLARWKPGDDLPPWAVAHVVAGRPVLAHNAAFEIAIIEHVLARQGFPVPALDQWRDTQQIAAAANLPLSLEHLAGAIAGGTQKDMAGSAVMKRFAVADPLTWRPPEMTPEEWEQLLAYCETDVVTMLDAYYEAPRPSVTEQAVAALDRRINHRGVYIDQEFAAAMLRMVRRRKETLAAEAFGTSHAELSNAVGAPSLREWLVARGFELPKVKGKASINKKFVEGVLEGEVDDAAVRSILENRIEASKITSLGKLKRVPMMVDPAGRLRNSLRYSAAHTGRWAGAGLQLHNLPRIRMDPELLDRMHGWVLRGDVDALDLFARPLEAMSQLLRYIVAAPPGRDLIGCDYSAIEARVIAWLAGQDDVLSIFASGQDIYVHDASEIGSTDRQLGKTCRLGLGFGMGALKFIHTAANAPVPILLSLKEGRRVQRAWREANPCIVQFWRDLEETVRASIDEPGVIRAVGAHLRVWASDSCLFIRLPSGRLLRYWRPSLRDTEKEIETIDDDGKIVRRTFATREIGFFTAGGNGMEAETTYGGKLAENVTQAIARDLLAEALLRIDGRDDYDLVLHVHDSVIAEVDSGTGDPAEFAQLCAVAPSWASGLPIEAKPYRSRHFRG